MGAYYDQRPFSVELVGAVCATSPFLPCRLTDRVISRYYARVLSSGKYVILAGHRRVSSRSGKMPPLFTTQLSDITRKERPVPKPYNFSIAPSRFLDLMSSSESMLVVPTLDIDLVWHSHQLSGPRYHKDCKTNVGRYVDQ